MVKKLIEQISKPIDSLYIIECYIPSDEKKVSWTIFKLQSIGVSENKKYGFISIDGKVSYGVGTGTHNWGKETPIEAVIQFSKIIDMSSCNFTLEGFEKALNIKDEMVKKLIKKLWSKNE